MKIIHIMWAMNIGGAERAVYQLIKGQKESGIDCSVLICNEFGFYGEKVKESGIEVYFLNMRNAYDTSKSKLFKQILSKFDAVHFHSAEPYLMYLASKINGLKMFYTHRGGKTKYPFKRNLRYKITGHIVKKYFTNVSGNTNAGRIAVSEMFKIPENKTEVTYNGLDFSLLKAELNKEIINEKFGIKGDDIIIGTSANLRQWKRIDLLIHSVSLIKDKRVKCMIIGDGPEKKNLELLAEKTGMKDKFIFTGKVTNIADYLQVADIFVLPSNSLESFGNSAVEAIALGIPTIVMKDGGGLPEHIIHNETGYIATDAEEITYFLERLINSKESRSDIGIKGKEYIRKKYSTENMIETYKRFYRIV